MSAAIEVRGLRKDYRAGLGGREVKALSGIDFAVQPGERRSSENPSPIRRAAAVSAQLGAAVVALACLRFRRKDF